jgi:hypothetical protein
MEKNIDSSPSQIQVKHTQTLDLSSHRQKSCHGQREQSSTIGAQFTVLANGVSDSKYLTFMDGQQNEDHDIRPSLQITPLPNVTEKSDTKRIPQRSQAVHG